MALFNDKLCSCYLASPVAGNRISRLSASPHPGLNRMDAKRRLCHRLLNSPGVIRHYQLRGHVPSPPCHLHLRASLPLHHGIQKTGHVFPRQPRQLPGTSCHARLRWACESRSPAPALLWGECSAGRQAGSGIREAHLGQTGTRCLPDVGCSGSSCSQNHKSKIREQKAVE